ncbi:MAG: stage II sporulation protein R [Clostridiaceae bacterium]|nr:stage II sporulation protein R [Clostridiaceae bacterium]
MKKIVIFLMILCICGSVFTGCTSYQENGGEYIYNYDDVKDILIRFHVIANSDTDEDQNLKLKVRDKVIEYLYPCLENSKSIDESRKILKDNTNKIKEIALNVIKENGYDYPVTTTFSHENIPEKSYGNIILPQGNYEAFRIIIGNGSGHNWWCVMFPPLCFIDVSKGKVEEDKSKKELDDQIERSKEESSTENDENDDEDIHVKFKIAEVFDSLFN